MQRLVAFSECDAVRFMAIQRLQFLEVGEIGVRFRQILCCQRQQLIGFCIVVILRGKQADTQRSAIQRAARLQQITPQRVQLTTACAVHLLCFNIAPAFPHCLKIESICRQLHNAQYGQYHE